MLNSLKFWTLLAALIAFVAKFFYPELPFDAQQILAFMLFVLGLLGITPQIRLMRRGFLSSGDLLKSLSFWTLVVGVLEFVVHFYWPTFPLDQANLLALILFVLWQIGIVPELRARGVLG